MTNELWWKLNGVFCIYKPPNLLQFHAKKTILGNVLRDLNQKFVPTKENFIHIEGSTASPLDVQISEKLAVHPLAIGDGFEEKDMKFNFANVLAPTSSGVCLAGINKGVRIATLIKKSNPIRTYRLSGLLGKSTIDLHILSKVKERSTYSHVQYHHMEKVLMTIQAIHQRRALNFLGGNPDSQGVYEAFASEGLVRPADDSSPLAYSLKCIGFEPPHFTLELSCINENEDFLRKLIHDLGLLLKTNATTTQVRCIRYGPFTVDDALLRKHWTLDHIIESIELLKPSVQRAIPDSPVLRIDNQIEKDTSL